MIKIEDGYEGIKLKNEKMLNRTFDTGEIFIFIISLQSRMLVIKCARGMS